MTTNQTIDGVPRAWLEEYEALADLSSGSAQMLRALLDAPVIAICRGCFTEQPMGKACKTCAEVEAQPAAQPLGEPVAMDRGQFEAWVLGREHPTYGWLDKHWLARGDNPETYADSYVQGLWVASQSLYAEKTAPVAVVMPERLPGDDGVCTESHYASGWNDCLDEVTRLNITRPTHANPPPGAEPCGTHRDNDGLDEMRKP